VDSEFADIVVVGAHLSGLPLNDELVALGASFRRADRTAPLYRLFALDGTVPPKPGMLRVAQNGASLNVEVWRLDLRGFGAFVSRVPAPLCIGTVELADGVLCKGFLVEPIAVENSRDISEFGGWREYINRAEPAL